MSFIFQQQSKVKKLFMLFFGRSIYLCREIKTLNFMGQWFPYNYNWKSVRDNLVLQTDFPETFTLVT